MAKLERRVHGDFRSILARVQSAVLNSSTSATLEASSDFSQGEFRCAVRVFERYSWLGSNRVSLTLTRAGSGEDYFLSAITSGGSQAIFFKWNTMGEQAFLNTISGVISSL